MSQCDFNCTCNKCIEHLIQQAIDEKSGKIKKDGRTLFMWPIRESTTRVFWPYKLTLKQFCEQVRGGIDGFERNMMNLGGPAAERKYAEQWAEQFLAWMEIEEE